MAPLSPTRQRFILHWGEMGTRWGINRTVAQIHAFLFLSAKPISADEIAATLSVARSNVSTSIRELEGWGIVRPVHVLGDRREHYESMTDVWEMFRLIVEQRKRREVDPTMQMLRQCLEDLKGGGDVYALERLQEMAEFFETGSAAYGELKQLSPATLRALVKAKGRVKKLLGRNTK